MKDKGLSPVLSVMILAVIAVGVRIFYINNMMPGAATGEGVHNAARMAVYLNCFYQVVSVVLLYVIVINISEKYFGFAAGLMAAIFPEYVAIIPEVKMLNMKIFIGTAVMCATVVFARRCLQAKPHDVDGESDGAYVHKEDALTKTDVLAKSGLAPIHDSSMKEIVLGDLDERANYIENPLPVPKRREHKEMDYAFEPSGDDDYDLTDMAGKDFYDIE